MHKLWMLVLLGSVLVSGCSGGGRPTRTAGYEGDVVGQSTPSRSLFQRLSRGESYRLEQLGFPPAEDLEQDFSRGQYLVQAVAACGHCHGADWRVPGSALSGGRLITDEFSGVRAANLTPHRKTGIGGWNIAHITRALRDSLGRKSSRYRWMFIRATRGFRTTMLGP